MKFNMMIGGVETLFPETEVMLFKEKNKIVIYFLHLNKEILKNTKEKITQANLRIEDNYLVLKLKDFQYAVNLDKYLNLIKTYSSGAKLRFAFEDEDGNILDIATPTFINEV